MNRVFKAVILSVAALTTVASTVELASAGDRYWRKHHIVKPWKKRVVVGGVTAGIVAGAVIATRPRVIYRADPVIIDEPRFYEDEQVYEDGPLYVDPDETYARRVYRDEVPEADEYASPRYEDEQFLDEQSTPNYGDDYFPEKPAAQVERQRETSVRKETIGKFTPTKEKLASSTQRKEANAAALKPWSKEWQQWCSGRFPSFNPQNGTYLGYDKKRHFCKAG